MRTIGPGIDTAVTTLLFQNGALGTIDNSRKAVYGYDQRVEVFGSEGMAQSPSFWNTGSTKTFALAYTSLTSLPVK
jgi:myo-inositol 2-dehydrogenase/D-chiro-inositol 1-dehydrogenase